MTHGKSRILIGSLGVQGSHGSLSKCLRFSNVDGPTSTQRMKDRNSGLHVVQN